MTKLGLKLCLFSAIGFATLPAMMRAEPGGFDDRNAGAKWDGAMAEPDGKLVRPVGDVLRVPGKPVDIVPSADGSLLFVKSSHGLTIVNAKTFAVTATLVNKDIDGSMHGLGVVAGEGGAYTVYFTTSSNVMLEAKVAADGSAEWGRKIPLGSKHSWGIAVSADRKLAYVCMSVKCTLAVVDLAEGKVLKEIPVGVAPYDVVLSPDSKIAYVTNYGGHPAAAGKLSEKSVGADVEVDKRTIPDSGTVSSVDLVARSTIGEIKTGLHPTQIIRDAKGTRYFVANANSDSVSVIDAKRDTVIETIQVRPDPALPFGSIPDGLALSADEKTLYVADAGNDAVAVISLGEKSEIRGFIPSAWFTGGVACVGNNVYIANTKSGSVSRVPAPTPEQLKPFTDQVLADERVPHVLTEMEKGRSTVAPVPVPAHVGEPSLFKHVIYILKENKKYDQVFGDIGKGNSDPKLCTFGQLVTPNQHAMANQFVLLDNYYCNGVNSSEGHQWATQGIIADYFEKGSRTYDFGTDALCYTSNDFIWDSCLMHGLSIRNYGEFDFPSITSRSKKWFDVYRDWQRGQVTIRQSVQFETLMQYTCHDYPGWVLDFPDVFRAKIFLKELAQFEKVGEMPNFLLIYLPQDHTAGRGQEVPAPRAMVADNDLATGQVVEALSKSRFWKDSCIFINEDDPQTGEDHVDGHRSFCLLASPYTKRGAVVSKFYNQTSVLHTMTNILGIPPLNQQCAYSSTMEDCFTDKPDMTPFQAVANTIALDEHNPKKEAMGPEERELADVVDDSDFSRPDRVNSDKFSRLLWIASGRTDRYPTEFSGAHGKGLAALHLVLDKSDLDGDDDGD